MAKRLHLLIVICAISCSASMKGASFKLLKAIAKDVDPVQHKSLEERLGGNPFARCFNTRDNRQGAYSCSKQIGNGYGPCHKYLKWKDCDKACNLCACSTSDKTNPQHCNGHGTCEASCDSKSCSGAKCVCDQGWTGSKCQKCADGWVGDNCEFRGKMINGKMCLSCYGAEKCNKVGIECCNDCATLE